MALFLRLEYAMNKFRVDRVNTRWVPSGMNSIRYIGDDVAKARRVFDNIEPGKDAWNQDDSSYGVVLSSWDTRTNQYEIIKEKGLS